MRKLWIERHIFSTTSEIGLRAGRDSEGKSVDRVAKVKTTAIVEEFTIHKQLRIRKIQKFYVVRRITYVHGPKNNIFFESTMMRSGHLHLDMNFVDLESPGG